MTRIKKSITRNKDFKSGVRPEISFEKELWDAAVQLPGNIAPTDYKTKKGAFCNPLIFGPVSR
jgi:hypothetical protein